MNIAKVEFSFNTSKVELKQSPSFYFVAIFPSSSLGIHITKETKKRTWNCVSTDLSSKYVKTNLSSQMYKTICLLKIKKYESLQKVIPWV